MKLAMSLAAAGLALATTAPASARTTVTRVHGPVRLIPHHKVKVCNITHRHGKRIKKCHYN